MTNKERLMKSVDRLQEQRAALLRKVDYLSQQQLDFRSDRLSWSVGQVTHHVGLAEELWQGYLRELLEGASSAQERTRKVTLKEVPFKSRLVPEFLLQSSLFLVPASVFINVLPRPVQSMMFAVPLIRMQSGPRMQPKAGLSLSELLQLLERVRRSTLEILKPVEERDLSRFFIDHPLIGKQNIYGMLELIASHDQRHALQIESVKRSPRFPA